MSWKLLFDILCLMEIVIVGGGAAGFFAAIEAKRQAPESDVIIVEKSNDVLQKVKISGGGRCNVTHACFDARQLSEFYPRGGKALIGPFQHFQPKDTMEWFESRGVALKVEVDNRVFPVSDSSQSIIDCLMTEMTRLGVRLWTNCGVERIQKLQNGLFEMTFSGGKTRCVDRIIMATGSSRNGYTLCQGLGHTIVMPIPSLFTIKIADSRLTSLLGLSVSHVELSLKMNGKTLMQKGPLLVTHWGLSGPAMIKLSAWAAREFYDASYQLPLSISWLAGLSLDHIYSTLDALKQSSKKMCGSYCPFDPIPTRLWVYFLEKVLGSAEKRWMEVSKKDLMRLAECMYRDTYLTSGKGQFKEEFVTCGGIDLSEVDFKTMESKICPGLFFAGELLNIDGVTGGFNFQNAWTTGVLAGRHVSYL